MIAILGLQPWQALLAVTIVFIGSATQASIGIGLGLLAAPTLTLIDPGFIPGAIAIAVVPLTIGMTVREFDHVDPELAPAHRLVGFADPPLPGRDASGLTPGGLLAARFTLPPLTRADAELRRAAAILGGSTVILPGSS